MSLEAKWYIITSMTGNEEIVYKNLEDKIRAYQLNDFVQEIKLLKSREITIEVFDNKINPPPKNMRSTKSISWETLPGNKYKKTRIREINRFPGYIYIKMIMTPEVWYTIRNTFGVTGFVGSSGKGAQPIPMSDIEVENLFNSEMNKDIIINKSNISYVDNNVLEQKPKEVKIEFLSQMPNNKLSETTDDFYNSKLDTLEEKDSLNIENKLNEEHNKEEIKINDSLELNKEIEKDINEDLDKNNIKFITEDSIDSNKEEINTKETKKCSDSYDFVIGNLVKILSGEMKDQKGYIIDFFDNGEKAKIEIELFGRKMILDLKCSEIAKDE